LTFLPATVGIVVGNGVAMRLAPRHGRSFTAAAIVVLLAGLVSIAALAAWRGATLSGWALAVPVVALGLGMGAVLNSLFSTSMAQVRPDQAGAASGLMNTTVQLGTATGIALFGTVFFSRLDNGFTAATTGAMAVSVGVLVVALLLTATLPQYRDRTAQPVA
jgi:predicted MFS family arabinose efflux permease